MTSLSNMLESHAASLDQDAHRPASTQSALCRHSVTMGMRHIFESVSPKRYRLYRSATRHIAAPEPPFSFTPIRRNFMNEGEI